MAKYRSEEIDHLFKAMLRFKEIDEFYDFFNDVCTITELKDMAQRFEVAHLLEGGLNYQKIAEQTGVSTATISRVSRCLNYGDGGYRHALELLKDAE